MRADSFIDRSPPVALPVESKLGVRVHSSPLQKGEECVREREREREILSDRSWATGGGAPRRRKFLLLVWGAQVLPTRSVPYVRSGHSLCLGMVQALGRLLSAVKGT